VPLVHGVSGVISRRTSRSGLTRKKRLQTLAASRVHQQLDAPLVDLGNLLQWTRHERARSVQAAPQSEAWVLSSSARTPCGARPRWALRVSWFVVAGFHAATLLTSWTDARQ